MGPDNLTKVAILQGNATVARLMRDALDGAGRFDVEVLSGPPPGAAKAQLVIIDVDSDLGSAEKWVHHCDGRQLPVLITGVERSREAYAERPWLSRPFPPARLRAVCRELLDPDPSATTGDDPSIPPPIQVDPDAQRLPTVEIPVGGQEVSEETCPTLDNLPAVRETGSDLLDIVELDGSSSMILEIEELANKENLGGMLVEFGQRRAFRSDELVEENPWEDIPDTSITGSAEGSDPAPSEPSHPQKAPRPRDRTTSSANADVTTISPVGDMRSNDFSGAHQVASLVAEHWDRMGLTARTTDRADRLQRVLAAMLTRGLEGVLDELKRIPAVTGFSGCISTMPIVDLLHTIRDRDLRGRLEVGLDGHSFVLYVEGSTLEAIDSLGENTSGLMVKFLRRQGAIDESTYRHYRGMTEQLSGEALQMELRREAVVGETDLRHARVERARYLLEKMCRGRRGTFAFIDVARESGQTWPNQGLGLDVDTLLLEIFRRDEREEASNAEGSRSDLVLNAERAARLKEGTLTAKEQQLLDFFEEGESVDRARDLLEDSHESVDEVIHRLKRLELLRRLGENPKPRRRPSQTGGGASRPDEEREDGKPTAVNSSWNLEVLDEAQRSSDTVSEPWPEPPIAGPHEETQEDESFAAGVPQDFSDSSRDD